MSDEKEEQPLVSKIGIVIDLILSFIVFIFLGAYVLPQHVPSDDSFVVNIVAFMTSFCMTGVFWMAVNMFRVTLVDFQRSKKS
ncbi:MAG: hypothetical protein P8P49_10690 [Opitutales bacterium]|nr:hypothetical protein [Opitutales bacterium]